MSETNLYTGLIEIPITKEEIDRCKYSNWYNKFIKHTTNSIIFKNVPSEFVEYLRDDGITLPNDNNDSFYNMEIVNDMATNEYSDWEDDDSSSSSSSNEEDDLKDNGNDRNKSKITPLKDFPEFHEKLKSVIKEYRQVGLTPKLNWSAPRDASWILPYNNTMIVKEVNDLYLLLNASNYIIHDLEFPYEDCSQTSDKTDLKCNSYELVLREWCNMNFALEFRVFIYKSEIIGVSQRDMKTNYVFLPELVPELKDRIDEFVYDVFLPNFYDNPDDKDTSKHNIVLDVYIPRPFQKVWLIDCNPFSRSTDALLFSWNELVTVHSEKLAKQEAAATEDYEMRLVDETSVGHRDHTENQVPIDIVQASLDPASLQELSRQWQTTLTLQQQEQQDQEQEE